MLYALDKEGNKQTAIPKAEAICPNCRAKVISKCGEINIWHWAHKNLEECDTFSEGETIWHLKWKSLFKKEFIEVTIENHRADIKIPDIFYEGEKIIPSVWELQNSPISPMEIYEREKFYSRMAWIINGEEFLNNFKIKPKYKSDSYHHEDSQPDYYSFRWKYPRKSLTFISKPFFIDFGSFIFHVKKISLKPTGVGWGQKYRKVDFIRNTFKKYLSEELKDL